MVITKIVLHKNQSTAPKLLHETYWPTLKFSCSVLSSDNPDEQSLTTVTKQFKYFNTD